MHVRRALALTVLAPLLLAGCSDGDPGADPTPKMPDPTSSSPSPTESETPEAESAEDFVRRWVKVGDEMQVTGDTAEYLSMVDKSCKACQGFAASVQSVFEAGGSAEFDGTEITNVSRYAAKPPTLDVNATVPSTIIHHADTGKDQKLPGGDTKIRVILKKVENAWSVTYFGIVQ